MDNTSGPVDLNALGFITGPPSSSAFTPGINQTYPSSNPAPVIADTSQGGFWNTIKDDASSVVGAVEAAPGEVWDGTKNVASTVVGGVKTAVVDTYDGAKSVVSTVGTDIGSGLGSVVGGISKPLLITFGVIVLGLAIVIFAAGKSGAVNISKVSAA